MHPLNQKTSQKVQTPQLPSSRTLPANLIDAIKLFKFEGYAKKFFSEQRVGIFRRKLPLQKMMVYQKVNKPLNL
jgi:hypothetical protein